MQEWERERESCVYQCVLHTLPMHNYTFIHNCEHVLYAQPHGDTTWACRLKPYIQMHTLNMKTHSKCMHYWTLPVFAQTYLPQAHNTHPDMHKGTMHTPTTQTGTSAHKDTIPHTHNEHKPHMYTVRTSDQSSHTHPCTPG
ncbi:potassium/sodium hyperpolarization-activated cyclic nucleotide-gated channel 2 [Platysternon megacephalum]|uniref:Potassium/sodium hyperpolarization-activated cyclic nucleotide-gated channel 2 n=1 Tax=Platysternon megacephalum TaxID=55544 RepID=A0A4D9EF58_9SAUR|nr:potassium/sodium hyperpolarization-activated cyclic nucleotide-gated channel 2 [Platysternon megacephalum]